MTAAEVFGEVTLGERVSQRNLTLASAIISVISSSATFAAPAATEATPSAGNKDRIETVVVTGRAYDLAGIAQSANQGTVGAQDIALRPILRPGEIVENVPGVIITQHSGSGKANQYFLRGFNLDHGTDLAVSVDDVPVNMPSHAHGQGYADLNFLIPELVEAVDYKKGPYYADVGDFGSAGAFNIRYYNELPNGLIRVEGGQFGYGRGLIASNARIGSGNAIYALEIEHNDGPWAKGDDARKLNTLVRYADGNEADGWSLTAMGYRNSWNSTDQIPDRAILGSADPVGAPTPPAADMISRWGGIDPSDGGKTGRYAANGEWHRADANRKTNILVYAEYYDLKLFSNFTYFLDDPIHGDQFEQQDNRYIFGGKAGQTWFGDFFGAPTQNNLGADFRHDNIRNGLFHTEDRIRIGTTALNSIAETSLSPYFENQTRWTDWFRTILGVRGDFYWFDVRNLAGGDSGNVQSSLFSPKASLIFGPWAETEFYINGGYGYHSNDARGVVSRTDPATPLPRSKGAEAGIRTGIVPGLQSSLSFWFLDLQSELVWEGDAGANAPSGPTRRYGIEFANFYAPTKWLTIDADYAWSHARFTDREPDGVYVPEALVATFDGGIAVHDLEGALEKLHGGLRLRYFGPRPLTQDNAIKSKATTLLYADIGYDIDDHWSVTLNVFNLLDARASDIDYFYTSRLLGEPPEGVDDIHTHPAEPREFRVAVTARL
jgi:hypothetical protein